MSKVGIFFGTSTGSTETVADMIAKELGEDAEGPFDVETLEGPIKSIFEKYDSLIVGTPTWNTGADTERSGTGWDEIYYGSMKDLQLQGKKVAVFGLGDQESYAENYADASGELHDVFQGLGCQMMGYTSQEGYEHEDSKAIRGDLFCGLLCDEVNQEELSEERAKNWVEQLKGEGFLEGGSGAASPVATSAPVLSDPIAVEDLSELEVHSDLLDQTIETHASSGFKSHYNPKTKSTMWVSSDGRSCYYTVDSVKTSVSP
jgi:flavodoxin I